MNDFGLDCKTIDFFLDRTQSQHDDERETQNEILDELEEINREISLVLCNSLSTFDEKIRKVKALVNNMEEQVKLAGGEE
ncbi:MAG: hypothetical protein WC373_11635 [Smithella sp.]|jgi:hypothetical protein